MFYEVKPTRAPYPDRFPETAGSVPWSSLEHDPLGRENLESRIGYHIALLLRSEAGDARARDELQRFA